MKSFPIFAALAVSILTSHSPSLAQATLIEETATIADQTLKMNRFGRNFAQIIEPAETVVQAAHFKVTLRAGDRVYVRQDKTVYSFTYATDCAGGDFVMVAGLPYPIGKKGSWARFDAAGVLKGVGLAETVEIKLARGVASTQDIGYDLLNEGKTTLYYAMDFFYPKGVKNAFFMNSIDVDATGEVVWGDILPGQVYHVFNGQKFLFPGNEYEPDAGYEFKDGYVDTYETVKMEITKLIDVPVLTPSTQETAQNFVNEFCIDRRFTSAEHVRVRNLEFAEPTRVYDIQTKTFRTVGPGPVTILSKTTYCHTYSVKIDLNTVIPL